MSEPIVNLERQGSGREKLKLTLVQVKPERSTIEKTATGAKCNALRADKSDLLQLCNLIADRGRFFKL